MRTIFILSILTFLFSCNVNSYKNATSDEVALKHIKSNIEFLASDELEGRETTKRGSKNYEDSPWEQFTG